MNNLAVFWPLLAHVLLVHLVYGLISRRRIAAVRSGEAKVRDFALRGSEPETSATAHNNLLNQFELPVLFYVLCLSLYVTGGVNWVTLALLWIFVVSRYAHAFVHVTMNRVMLRRRLFIVGLLALLVAWVWFALHIAGVI